MSVTKRLTEQAEQYVSEHQKTHETWMEALDRLLGLTEEPMTEERVRKIVREEVEQLQRR